MLGDSLVLETLERQHPHYAAALPEMKGIDLLVSGGYRLKQAIASFLPQRVGEEPAIYAERLKKFTYRNILGDSIRKQVSRMSNGQITIAGIPLAEEDFWHQFRESTDGRGRTEMQLAGEVFRESLKFKKIYAHVDRDPLPHTPRNRAEEDALGLLPYVCLYSAGEVVEWSESDDRLDWIKVRQVDVDSSDPFLPILDRVTWTFINLDGVYRYSAYVELDASGKVIKILNRQGDVIGSDPKTPIAIAEPPTLNALGVLPVLKFELSDDLWVTNEASSKAYEHLRLDCHKFDLLTQAFFQRIYQPIAEKMEDSSFTESENDGAAPAMGAQYIPKLAAHEWTEPRGWILAHIFTALDAAERQVKEAIALTGGSAEPGAVEQSGVSKSMDFVMSNESLAGYGHLLSDFIQDIYQLIAAYRNRGYAKDISVSGLDNFEIDSLDKQTDRLALISTIDVNALRSKLPPTLFMLVFESWVGKLAGNLTSEQRASIQDEIEAMAIAPVPVEPPKINP